MCRIYLISRKYKRKVCIVKGAKLSPVLLNGLHNILMQD